MVRLCKMAPVYIDPHLSQCVQVLCRLFLGIHMPSEKKDMFDTVILRCHKLRFGTFYWIPLIRMSGCPGLWSRLVRSACSPPNPPQQRSPSGRERMRPDGAADDVVRRADVGDPIPQGLGCRATPGRPSQRRRFGMTGPAPRAPVVPPKRKDTV